MITVDDEVIKMVEEAGCDFRVCTACIGPALVSVAVKPPKDSDLRVPCGKHTIFVSKLQAQYIDRITMDMIYDEDEIDTCPAFYPRYYYK